MTSTLSSTNRLQNITPVVLRDLVFDRIQLAILEKQLTQGDRIHEQELTQRLNVSRTPVREALVLLERDGLVVSVPNRGTFVRKFDEQDIQEIFTMRTALENLASTLVLPKIGPEHLAHMKASIDSTIEVYEHGNLVELSMLDLEFHRYLVALADNSRLLQAWRMIAVQYTVVLNNLEYIDFDAYTTIKDHRALLEAYRSKNLEQIQRINTENNRYVASLCIKGYLAQREQELTVA
jgi:DNA-binding GntR family transcriptional regulator